MKKKIISIIAIIGCLILIYELIDSVYYKSFSGNQDIVFVDFSGTKQKDYLEIAALPQLRGKWIFATLNLRGDWDEYKPDLEMMDRLYDEFKESNVVLVYTVDSINRYNERYDWKKTIKKYNLKGFHIDLPDGYENKLLEDSYDGMTRHTKIPKYMIISDKGELIDKWSPRPSNYKKLIERFNELQKQAINAQLRR